MPVVEGGPGLNPMEAAIVSGRDWSPRGSAEGPGSLGQEERDTDQADAGDDLPGRPPDSPRRPGDREGRGDGPPQPLEKRQSDRRKSISGTSAGHTENYPTDLSLKLRMVRQKGGLPDPRLQAELRGRLRLLENDSGEVTAVFNELSARMLSIHSDQDLIVVTFKTFEEIWKFSTYYSLGFLNHCMENVLLDPSFWLLSHEEDGADFEEAGIEVEINEEALNLMYRSLLIQEGSFFVLCPDNEIREMNVPEGDRKSCRRSSAMSVEEAGGGGMRGMRPTGPSLVPASEASPEPLIPFHQWVLKMNSEFTDLSKAEPAIDLPIAVGSTLAVASYESRGPEELSFQNGDRIEIIGSLLACLPWFVGRHEATGRIGFVKTGLVKGDARTLGLETIYFLDEKEESFFTPTQCFSEDEVMRLLKRTSTMDVCTVYCVEGAAVSRSPELSDVKRLVEEALDCCRRAAPGPTEEAGADPPPDGDEAPAATQDPRFCVRSGEGGDDTEGLHPLLLFLNREDFQPGFRPLYDFSSPFPASVLHGYADEEEAVAFLTEARGTAKRANLPMALSRLCFLLGRACLKKLKLSQARVYLEEALGALRGNFGDRFLVAAVYANLAAIYLRQKNREKWEPAWGKAAALLMGIPGAASGAAETASDVLRRALKGAVRGRSRAAEARACFLLARHHVALRQPEGALPFLERLQVLNEALGLGGGPLATRCYFHLGELYALRCLPRLTLSCVEVASSSEARTLADTLRSVGLVLEHTPRDCGPGGDGRAAPSQAARYLRRALRVASREGRRLRASIHLSLAGLHAAHGRYGPAAAYAAEAARPDPAAPAGAVVDRLVSLAWLYLLRREPAAASDVLASVLDFPGSGRRQVGVASNMRALALKRMNRTRQAARGYARALRVARELGLARNEAVALANLGSLCLQVDARRLAESYYVAAVKVFSGLPGRGRDFSQVLLRLGHYYTSGAHRDKGKCYYEWAFLVALESEDFEGQLQALRRLCHFYSVLSPNEAQCLIYNECQLALARRTSNKELEGQLLETISQLYLSLGTERAYKSALEYTKRSLGIFIDLQKKEKEAYAWLQAGKIYYILRQNELVDLYIQVAQEAALYTGDPETGARLFEAAGDIFFNGPWEREKAVSFYRDKALPLVIGIGDREAELRLCNKLVELLFALKAHGECLEFAQMSLALSVNLGDRLNERVAYHRLAAVNHRLGHSELAEHFYLKALSLCSSPLQFDEETLYYVRVYLILGDIIFYDLKVRTSLSSPRLPSSEPTGIPEQSVGPIPGALTACGALYRALGRGRRDRVGRMRSLLPTSLQSTGGGYRRQNRLGGGRECRELQTFLLLVLLRRSFYLLSAGCVHNTVPLY
uniref:SH3 domain and tetratricopeptide repeats 1 n=1 Tax=Ornithorhynchus anatinus TaxID=9258 RepID=A0A6I8P3I9_ORNAN